MSHPLYHVDAFAEAAFKGNPAAVCLLREPGDAAWMAAVAMEMNLSETAFVCPRGGGGDGGGFSLRWFTPAVEVALCGHATLASAHVLWEAGRLGAQDVAEFHTQSGLLTCRRRSEGLIEMDFPAKAESAAPAPPGLSQSLGGVKLVYVGRNAFDYLVEVESAAVVREMRPDHVALAKLPVRGVMVTARGDDGRHDFVSRFFAPGAGVAEDPVTGSAHCCLTPYWAGKLGKREMAGYQASRRGGTVWVELAGDRVLLAGRAVTTARGELLA